MTDHRIFAFVVVNNVASRELKSESNDNRRVTRRNCTSLDTWHGGRASRANAL